ncbi:MAG: hypothetical protein RR766_04765 [Longicatena sp.]|jgi:hypothetical protein|uniref:hypothetical protein n=1 Tax=Anaerorhabdus sp. TaxID=1872524 RepID=UPI002FCAC99F
MILEESNFTEIYHKYLVFEVDDLTDECKDIVNVDVEDCYMLATAIVDALGNLIFPVLSIGPSVEHFEKGLDILEPLAEFSSFDIEKYEFIPFDQPTFKMQVKAASIFEVENCSQELAQVRRIKELDGQRDLHYPDILNVHFLSDGKFYRYLVEALEYNSRFIEGRLLREPERDIGIHQNDHVEVVPVMLNNQLQLVSANSSVNINDDTFEKLRDFVNEILEEYPDIEKRKKS